MAPIQDRTIIYARKSSESEDRQVLSIESQISELTAFAKQTGLHVAHVFRESKSAKAPGRPIFGEMMASFGKDGACSVLCWKLDRLARNPVDGGALIWAMEEGNITGVHTPQRSFGNTGNDKFWMQLEFGMAKKYVDDLSDNTKRGLKTKVEQGWRPGRVPLGYINDRTHRTIVPDPERFIPVRQMWNLMLSGKHSVNAVLKIADEKLALRTRQCRRSGGGKVAYSTMYSMFVNPFYYGLIRYGSRRERGKHEPMVTKAEFDRVQVLLRRRSRTRPQRYAFKYTGLIICGECGAAVTAEHKKNRFGYRYIYYHCTRRKRHVVCTQKCVEESGLEQQIMHYLKTISIRRSFLVWAKAVLHDLEGQEVAKSKAAIEALQRRVKSLEKERSELIGLKLRGMLNDEEFRKKKQELEGEALTLESAMRAQDNQASSVTDGCLEFFDFAYSAQRRFLNGTDEEKRDILSRIGSNLVLKDRKLLIKAKKPIETIQEANRITDRETARFEPEDLRYSKSKNPALNEAFSTHLRLVKDVRTYVREETMNGGVINIAPHAG